MCRRRATVAAIPRHATVSTPGEWQCKTGGVLLVNNIWTDSQEARRLGGVIL